MTEFQKKCLKIDILTKNIRPREPTEIVNHHKPNIIGKNRDYDGTKFFAKDRFNLAAWIILVSLDL